MSSHRHGGALIAGKHCHGLGGLGVLGSDVPSTGQDGAAPLFNDLNLPTDASREYRFQLISIPDAGSFFMWADSSFQLIGAPDGVYTVTGYVYEDGVRLMPIETVTIAVGARAIVTLSDQNFAAVAAGRDFSADSAARNFSADSVQGDFIATSDDTEFVAMTRGRIFTIH